MSLFSKACRNAGLFFHGVLQPIRQERETAQRQELRRTVEEEQVSSSVTVRRTTIEEIEVRNRPTSAVHDTARRQENR